MKKLIGLKFGDMHGWAEAQIASASTAQLEAWLEAILNTDSLEALFDKH